MIDRYTKVILTVIGAALTALVIQNATTGAIAQGSGCGSALDACYITARGPIEVIAVNP